MKDVKIKVANALLVGGMVLSTVSPQLLGVQARNDAAALLDTEPGTTDLVNLAKGKTATASEEESGTEFKATKAVDGIVNRDAENKADQSRWGTSQLNGTEEAWLKVDLGETKTFQSFVIAWERQNITEYQIQTSNTGDGDWETVYTKDGNGEISDVVETIHLDEAVTAQYVRLLVTGYNGKYVDGNPDADWKSVSVYEFQVYENDIPDDLLPDENYNREGKATASNSESGTSFTSDKAIDGNTKDKASRWATDTNSSNLARTLTIELPVSQRVRSFKIFWERANIEQYTISVSNDGTSYEDVYTSSEAVSETEEVITLDKAVWAKYVKLNVTKYNGGNNNWPNVSLYEFEAYANVPKVESPDIEPDDTAKEAAAKLKTAPTFNEDQTALVLPEVPEGFKVEFLADLEQIVAKDGKIYQPLTDTAIKGIYKITKGEETAESTTEFALTIPGIHETAGENTKPTVIPELAEWHGESGDFKVKASTRLVIDASAKDIANKAAQAFQADYKEASGKELEIVTDETAKPGDIFFTKDTTNNLGKEGYIMDIDDIVTIKAEQSTGAYWSTRSMLQILKLEDDTMPKGLTRDYPKYSVRSFSLDVARKPVSMETLNSIAKEMAYYKMNDFQVHLNDNLIFYEDYGSVETAMEKAYTGFRLESDIKKGQVIEGDSKGVANAADLTSKDLSYSKKEFREFILDSREMGVNIVPEFDAPGHSGAFMDVRPDLHLKKTVEGNAARAGEQFDLSDEHYADSSNFIKKLWDEYLTEDMFDSSMVVHVGTDEYYGDAEAFRKFSDDIIEHVQETNPTVRMWGSLSHKNGTTPVRSKNVQMNCWYNPYAQPKDMYEQGYQLINTVDGDLYMVPAAGYYGDYLNTQRLFNNWQVNRIGGVEISAASEQMLGSTFAIWNDSIDTRANGISEVDIYDRFIQAVPTLASKNWGDAKETTYAELTETVEQLGDAPGHNPYHKASAKDGKYMEYKFEANDTKGDASENNRDLLTDVNAKFEKGALTLSGDESYVTTPIEKLATGNTLEFDITLNQEAKPGEILFEADAPGNERYVHDIRILDDGTLGYKRELYDFSFGYKLPVGQKVHLAISTDGIRTYLFVNGEKYNAVGKYVDETGEVKQENIKPGLSLGNNNGGYGVGTLLLPIQRIGSTSNAIDATIDNVVVSEGVQKDTTILDGKTFTVTTNNEQSDMGTEGPISYAFDGNLSTIWHTSYSPYKNLPAEVIVDMNKTYDINKLTYIPRSSGTNGNITKYSLYYQVENSDEWVPIIEEGTWDGNGEEKIIKFDQVTARKLKFIALDGVTNNPGKPFAAAAEFYVHQVVSDQPDVEADKELLSIAIAAAKEITQEHLDTVIPVVAKEFKEALANAEAVYADDKATQEEVNNVFDRLANAMHMLDFIKGDKASLKTFIDKVSGLESSKYTEATWTPFNDALTAATNVYNDENAMQEEINTVYTELVKAFVNLRLIPNKDLLEDLINQANGLNVANYTKASFDGLTKALNEAKAVFDDPNATQEQVNSAKDVLAKAMAGLQTVTTDNTVSTPVSNGDTTVSVKTGDDALVGTLAGLALLSIAGAKVLRKKED